MQSSASEKACLFCIDGTSSSRKVVERIQPGTIIGFMNATPWCGQSRDKRRKNAMERIQHFVDAIQHTSGINPVPHEKICGYASPDEINIEDRWTRISKNTELESFQQKFVDNYLVPLLSFAEGETRKRLPLEQAMANMRLTLVGFSYGGIFIAGIRRKLIQAMTNLDYMPDEIEKISAQVYQVNFGVQRSENDAIKPKFNEINLVTRGDDQGIWESWAANQAGHFILLDNPTSVTNTQGQTLTKPHSQEMYVQSLARKPELCREIAENISGAVVQPIQYSHRPEEIAYIQERLGILSYRMQMMQRH